jgi:hypothetical protein
VQHAAFAARKHISGLVTRRPYASLAALGALITIPFAIRGYMIYFSYDRGLPYGTINHPRAAFGATIHENSFHLSEGVGVLSPGFSPHRSSSRPQLGPHPIPQRQVSQLPDDATREQLIARFEALAKTAQEKELVEIKRTLYERRHSALFVLKKRNWKPLARRTRGKTTPVHAGLDLSIHVVLHQSSRVSGDDATVFQALES